MSDAGHGRRSADTDNKPAGRSGEIDVDTEDLLSRFRNAREAMPEKAVAKPSSDCFHRHEAEVDDPAPACQKTDSSDFHAVDVDEALLAGLDPCRACWRAVLEYLAAEPDSPVAYRSPAAAPEPTLPTTDEPLPTDRDETDRPSLSAPTDEVMINGANKYHAPAGGETLCGRTGYRVVDRRAVVTHYDPCRDCFDADVVEE